jgi:hypothetical protein
MPMSFVSGALNTLNAYAWPIHKCTDKAAGGTRQRLKSDGAVMRCLEKNRDMVWPIQMFNPVSLSILDDFCERIARLSFKVGKFNRIIDHTVSFLIFSQVGVDNDSIDALKVKV